MLELSSPLKTAPLRLSLVGQHINILISSAKKKRKSNSIAGPASLDEENTDNQSVKSLQTKSPVKKTLAIRTDPSSINPSTCENRSMMDCALPTINTDIDNLKLSDFHSNLSPNVSESGTEVSSVSERREWLKNFEKKQANNVFRSLEKNKARDDDDRNNHETRNTDREGRESPPASSLISASTSSKSSPAINVLPLQETKVLVSSAKKPKKPRPAINRRASSSHMPSWVSGSKKVEVKATDDGYASVASLSKWLEADPTSAKKKRHVRRGRNIISKSRQFETDSGNVIVMEAQISRGAVGDKKKWLQNAFQSTIEEDNEDDTSSTVSGYVKSEVGRSVRSHHRYNRQGAQTEIITNDAASSLSVADKKDWLKKAFVKNSEERKKLGYTKAKTDVIYNRGQNHDEAASRAKLRFKERSARKLTGTISTRPSGKPAPSSASNSTVNSTSRVDSDDVYSSEKMVVEEDNSPVDFRAARDALVQRSNRNGHDTEVLNKVFLRKKKLERREEESRRKSMSVGLVLKPSWDKADVLTGHPSNVYEKKYVPGSDIAPKKSFEDLP
eukprot:CAMPEP_0197187058 /NCGR_PEP_ID=MMETSP1423-20130617/15140_1 /TAXON_ID=476441 /ORGANISM="Pseudo-nitzschia heimii, Strain UNC1101" /LENGTH=558 /DNA_ID=CAMNT_0042638537 /DNA_START=72 /DNA_END=1748 /DNA_ORIENTATION=-